MDSNGHLGMFNNQLAGFSDKEYPTVSSGSPWSGITRLNRCQQNYSREIEKLQHKLLVHAKKNEMEITVAKKTIQDDLKTRIGESLR